MATERFDLEGNPEREATAEQRELALKTWRDQIGHTNESKNAERSTDATDRKVGLENQYPRCLKAF